MLQLSSQGTLLQIPLHNQGWKQRGLILASPYSPTLNLKKPLIILTLTEKLEMEALEVYTMVRWWTTVILLIIFLITRKMLSQKKTLKRQICLPFKEAILWSLSNRTTARWARGCCQAPIREQLQAGWTVHEWSSNPHSFTPPESCLPLRLHLTPQPWTPSGLRIYSQWNSRRSSPRESSRFRLTHMAYPIEYCHRNCQRIMLSPCFWCCTPGREN